MMNADTKSMIEHVENLTGYRVDVSLGSGFYEQAQMISARPESPVHMIRVNTARETLADYIVAAQCGILLVMWSDPTKVFSMVFNDSACAALADEWAQSRQLSALPEGQAQKTARFYVEGLLKQLHSMPLEIRVANYCFDQCPSLRPMQAAAFESQLRELSTVFSPQIRERAPEPVFDRNVTMNAALALNWARLSGSRLAPLPYETLGYADSGQKLLAALDAAPGMDREHHIQTVDAWADELAMRPLYRWEFSDRR